MKKIVKVIIIVIFILLISISYLLYHQVGELKFLIGEKMSHNLNIQQITLSEMEKGLNSQNIEALLYQSDLLKMLNGSSFSSKIGERRLQWYRDYEKLSGIIATIEQSDKSGKTEEMKEGIADAHAIINGLLNINGLAIEICSSEELSLEEQMNAYYELLIPDSDINRKIQAFQ